MISQGLFLSSLAGLAELVVLGIYAYICNRKTLSHSNQK